MPTIRQMVREETRDFRRTYADALRELERLVRAMRREFNDLREDVARNNKNWIDATGEQREIKSRFTSFEFNLDRLDREIERRDNRLKAVEARLDNHEAMDALEDTVDPDDDT